MPRALLPSLLWSNFVRLGKKLGCGCFAAYAGTVPIRGISSGWEAERQFKSNLTCSAVCVCVCVALGSVHSCHLWSYGDGITTAKAIKSASLGLIWFSTDNTDQIYHTKSLIYLGSQGHQQHTKRQWLVSCVLLQSNDEIINIHFPSVHFFPRINAPIDDIIT